MNKKNKIKGLFSLTALSLTLHGCTLWTGGEETLTDPDNPHVDAQQSTVIQLPGGAKTPEYSDEFKIPQVAAEAQTGELGSELDISSPRLVLPVVTGSRILEGSREAVVQFDQVYDDTALDTAIWNSLLSYLEERGIGVVDFDKSKQKLKTDWMIIEADDDSPWYSWTKTDRTVGQRFEFTLDLKSHGRSATLYTKLVDYLETIDEEVIADIPSSQVRNNEIEVLNNVISHYEKQLVLADIRKLRKIQTGIPTELGFNSDGDSSFLASADYDVTWPRLLLVLRKLGFNVKDLDKSTGLIFVTYSGVDEGWWDSLFSSSSELPLEKSDYHILVKEQGAVTSITFKNENNEALSASMVSDMYTSFANVMATDDLDI